MNRSMRSLGFILILTISSFLFAQMTVSGTVTDAATGAALAGANAVSYTHLTLPTNREV